MRKSNKILNYIVMACAVFSTVIFIIAQNWSAVLWAFIAFIWIADCHLTEDNYYNCKKSLDKLTDDYCNTLIIHRKEIKELKDEIESLK